MPPILRGIGFSPGPTENGRKEGIDPRRRLQRGSDAHWPGISKDFENRKKTQSISMFYLSFRNIPNRSRSYSDF
jgi:hypothetical protein